MFIDDISVRGMIFAVTIRSPYARGRLLEIIPPKLPASYTLISAADIPGRNRLHDLPVPVLAGERVSYIGEPVALIAGPDEYKLEEYAKGCVVRVDEEIPRFSISEEAEDSLVCRREYNTGDTESIFAAASSIIEGEYSTGIQEHWYSNPHGALAFFTDEKLKIYTASQWAYHVKRSACGVLKMDDSVIVVEQTGMDVHLDGKIWYPSLISCQAALAAHVTKKPVKLMLTREEDFIYSPKRNASKIRMRSALGEKGEILGTEIHSNLNLGAHGVFAGEIIDHSCLGSLGIYELGKIKLEARALNANIPPQGPFAGFGLSQGFFAIERHVSAIAEFLKEDPAEWRKRHRKIKNNTLAIGIPLKESPPVNELLDSAARMGDYYRKWASYELLRRNRRSSSRQYNNEPLRGIGIASAYQGAGFLYSGNEKGSYAVELTLEKDGSLEIKACVPDTGKEKAAIWKNMAQEILGVNPDQIKFVSGTHDPSPCSLSRNITVLTRLVEKCCNTIKKQRFRDPLPIRVRRAARPEKINPWGFEEKTADPNAFLRPGWAAAAVEIEIDHVSLQPGIRGIWLAVDGGKILSETRARRALRASVIHAMGWAAREHIDYFEGQIQRYMMHNYEIATPIEIPPIHIEFIKNDSAAPKGIGDLPYSCVPAAYVEALSQAMDYNFTKIPISAHDIWEANLIKKAEARAEEQSGEEKSP